MESDSWPLLQLFIWVVFLPLILIKTGVLIEESGQKEIEGSGIGISIPTISAFIISGGLIALAVSSLYSVSKNVSILIVSLVNLSSNLLGIALLVIIFAALLFILASLCMFALTFGRAHSEKYEKKLLFLDIPLKILSPISKATAFFAKKSLSVRGVTSDIGSVTEEDVRELMDSAEERDVIDENQRDMINNIFELDDVTVGDIMTHRTELESVSSDASPSQLISAAVEYGYSRIPIYEGTLDNIIGVAYAKDLLKFLGGNTGDIDIKAIVRPALFVPESMRAKNLLFEFRQTRTQFAVVVDEYGGTAGIVTMEDILESIVGDIEDEYDEEDTCIVFNEDGSLTCDGYAEVEEVFKALGVGDVPDDVDSDTVGGLVTDLLKRLPKNGEFPTVAFNNLLFNVLDSDERRITSVLVKPADVVANDGITSAEQ